MPQGVRLVLTLVALICAGAFGFYHLTLWGAPAHDQAALGVAFGLVSFGAAAAKIGMELVVVPLGVLRMLERVFRGHKPVAVTDRRDPLDVFGRVVFVGAYAAIAGAVGAVAGLGEGGASLPATAAGFAIFAALLAMLVPNEVLWATEGSEGRRGLTEQQRAERKAGLEAGDPATVFADRVARGIVDKFVDDQRKR